ncbi:hypothetical protein [Neptunitalea lumnitzerae]|uniref:hypothetical protein n=1 Tax=Neptunitalea lumnitzerae TaxID=2965509 RepID=UPI0024928DB7|nr:hypothetical protein [Neptunitalea sp. Y10]
MLTKQQQRVINGGKTACDNDPNYNHGCKAYEICYYTSTDVITGYQYGYCIPALEPA